MASRALGTRRRGSLGKRTVTVASAALLLATLVSSSRAAGAAIRPSRAIGLGAEASPTPTLGREAPIGPGPAPAEQTRPNAAWNGTNHLVVWTDTRNGDADVYGARVSASGAVLDTQNIPIAVAAGTQQTEPAVAWNGTNFLVVWTDQRGGNGRNVYSTRVSPSGTVLSPAGVPLTTATNDQTQPAVAAIGGVFMAVWTDARASFDQIRGTRVNDAGAVLEPSGILVADGDSGLGLGGQYDLAQPAIASRGGDEALVAYEQVHDLIFPVRGVRVDDRGGVVGEPIDIGEAQDELSFEEIERITVAWSGTSYLVAWGDTVLDLDLASDNALVLARRVDATGGVLGTASTKVTEIKDVAAPVRPSVAWDGSSFVVAWASRGSSGNDVFGSRISRLGSLTDTNPKLMNDASGTQETVSVAPGAGRSLLVWSDNRSASTGFDVVASRFAPNLITQDGLGHRVSGVPGTLGQSDPTLAWNGSGYLAAWTGTGGVVLAARLDADGGVIDTDGIVLALDVGARQNPSVAWNGTAWLVAWEDTRNAGDVDIYATRISASGAVLDPTGIAVSTFADRQANPSVSATGSTFLVTWDDARAIPAAEVDVYAARVSGAGAVLDPSGIPVSTTAGVQAHPSVASNGLGWFVTWDDTRNPAGTDVYGSRVTTQGAVADPAGLTITGAIGSQTDPSVAWGDSTYLVTWTDRRQPIGAPDIYASRVGPGGAVLDPAGLVVSTASNSQSLPSVAFNDTFLVTWRDRRNSRNDVFAARVTTAGVLNDPGGVAIEQSVYDSGPPLAAAGPEQRWAVAYGRNQASFPAAVFLAPVIDHPAALPPFSTGPVPAVSGSAPTTAAGYTPVGGDFNGDGRGDVFWYGAGATKEVLWTGLPNARFSALATRQQAGTVQPVAGDFNGDGKDDIFWYAPGAATESFWLGTATGGFLVSTPRSVSGSYVPVVGEFTGDGKDDIYWYSTTTGAESLWTGSATASFASVTTRGQVGALVPIRGDFSGDGTDDVFWYAAGSGAEELWLGDPTGTFSVVNTRTVSGTYTPVAGDFNGDGYGDIFWYAPGTAAESYWAGWAGGFRTSPANIVNGTYVPVVIDVDGDHQDDVYWYAAGNAADALFLGR